jgi:uncharacterized membrane protein (UPF0127 family)
MRGWGLGWQTARPVPWLLCDGIRVAPVEVASLPGERSRGLLGRDGIDGALLLAPAVVVHTFGMRFALDVAFCDRDLRVLGVATMPRYRLSRPRIRARAVLEAEAGAFARWGVKRGSRLAISGD